MRLIMLVLAVLLPVGAALAAETTPEVSTDDFFGNTLAVFDLLTTASARAALQLAGLVDDFGRFPSEVALFFERLDASGFSTLGLLWRAAFYLGLGVFAELLFRTILNRISFSRNRDGSIRLGHRLGWLGANLVGLLIFAVLGGWPLLMSTQSDPVAQTVVVTYLTAILGVRLFTIGTRQVLAPFKPEMRLVMLSDADARRLYWHALLIAAWAIFFVVTATLFQSGGMERNAILIFVLITRTLVALAVILACFANRRAIAGFFRKGADGRDRGRGWSSFAGIWHLLVSFYVVVSWFAASILLLLGRMEANRLAVLSFFALMALTAACLALDDWAARVDSRAPEREKHPDMPSFAQFFARLGRASATVITLLVLLRLWSGPWSGFVTGRAGTIVPALTQLCVTLFIAYVLWQLVAIGSERMLQRSASQSGETDAVRQTRVATLLPLIRNITLVAIAIIAGMIGLSAIGVDVLPLFAGAGVLGLAIGMGSQTLVRDVISGVFFLLDDAFRVGDFVDTGVAIGTIERAGIRSLGIRHTEGALHTVPFGEIKTISNHSRDWAIFKMDFRVPFETDTDSLRKKFKVLGQQLSEDPVHGHLFVEPLKSAGVVRMDESAMIVRAKFKCRPGEQFQLRRVVYEAVRRMFREEGIDVAVREVRVRATNAIESNSTNAGASAEVLAEAIQAQTNPSDAP
ncbi:mechanosensitive ion channel family protein [Shimia aestuarii]|uniref:Small-conductance mechanosensitive channel n=1 Tax=Shimia aestuarii TaxID=254406 RepID=A0A1I4P8L1_9RHOB|nr:mechanosensitive ion channel domain-containing protein [Shimia aestuarii]SFM24138.1 Small-conductance mechanosensitive channel [Shimia aestuarii]